MGFYLLLMGWSTIIATLTLVIWVRTRSVEFVVGFAFLYFWSLWGAWFMVHDLLGESSVMHYQYLFERLFPIALDSDYAYALTLYALFIVVVQGTVLFVMRRNCEVAGGPAAPIAVSHFLLIGFSAACGVTGFMIVRPYLAQAVAQELSAYLVVATASREGFPLYSIARLAMSGSMLAGSLGLAVYASGSEGRYATGQRGTIYLLGYAVVLLPIAGLAFALGTKRDLFLSFIGTIFFYLANASRPKTTLIAAIGLAGIGLFATIDALRGLPLAQLGGQTVPQRLGNALFALITSNEAFGAHFSMYGALHFDIPLTFGASFLNLVASVVPRFLWLERPRDVYQHYAQGVHAVDNAEYTVHHATGWYLNFGLLGVILGAVLLGALWGWLYNQRRSLHRGWPLWRRAFGCIAFPLFSAGMPGIVRSGPEAYKGILFELILLPTVLLVLSSLRLSLGMKPGSRPEASHRYIAAAE